MLLEAATLDLMLAIGQNGFFPGEPLLVVKENDMFRVIEGNRRLTALLILRDPSVAPVKKKGVQQIYDAVEFKGSKIKEIPCQVFTQVEPIHKYLGYRHITGVQSWDLTQKAAFLSEMRDQEFSTLSVDEASRELAKMIGSRHDYVKRLLIGYEVFEKIRDNDYFKVRGLDESSIYFNYIADSLRQPNIAEFIGVSTNSDKPTQLLDCNNLELWTRWFFEKNPQNQPRIRATSQELKMLNAVLENERALSTFRDDGKALSEAYELTGEIENVFRGLIATAISSLETADSLTHKLEQRYQSLQDDLVTIGRLARKIRIATEEELDDDDD